MSSVFVTRINIGYETIRTAYVCSPDFSRVSANCKIKSGHILLGHFLKVVHKSARLFRNLWTKLRKLRKLKDYNIL